MQMLDRILILLMTLFWLCSAGSATALAIFDFDNIPPFTMPLTGAPVTYLYQCDGKSYCTDADLYRLAMHTGFGTVSTARAGITLTLHNTGLGGYHLAEGDLDAGNFIGDYDDAGPFYVAGFSLPLAFARVELWGNGRSDPPAPGIYELFLEGYDGPEATGAILGRSSADLFDGRTTLGLTAPGMRSLRFGSVGIPGGGCSWCLNSAGADNIAVEALPEPGSGALLGIGGAGLLWARAQIRPRPSRPMRRRP